MATVEHKLHNALYRRVRNKLDIHILPFLSLLYLVNFLDRTNIGNAKIAGLVADTHLLGDQYNVGLTVFYVSYILCEMPSNWVLKKIGANWWLGILTIVWGIVTTLTGLIENFASLIAVRFFLGLCEGGILPGVTLYLSTIYPRHELQFRIALFWAPATLSGAFGGLLASAIILMDGVGGLAGWRWIFILEGIASCLAGILISISLPRDIPSARSLTQDERECALERLEKDAGYEINYILPANEAHPPSPRDEKHSSPVPLDSDEHWSTDPTVPSTLYGREHFELREVVRGLLDVHAWLAGISYFGVYVSLFSLSYFIPTIIAGLGYSGVEAQLHTVPPYVVATVATVGVAFLSDRYKMRGPMIMGLLIFGIAGYALAIAGKTNKVRYGAVFLMTFGVFPTAPCILALIPNNSSGHYKRATAVGLALVVASTGGFLSTFVYTPDQAPDYVKGHSLVLGLLCMSWVLTGVNVLYCVWENKARADGRRQGNITAYLALRDEGKTNAPIGDRHPDFRYTL